MSDEKNQADEVSEKPEKVDEKPATEKSPKELGGRKGPEPTRYGDWENKGIASDF